MIINQKYLKEYGLFPRNYDLTEAMQYVPVAEALWVIPIIGDDLYLEIQGQVDANEVSEENATLLTEGGLYRLEAMAVLYEMLPMAWASLSEVGITLGHSDNSDSLSLKDMTYVEGHLKRQLAVLEDFTKGWLKAHASSFPLWKDPSCSSCCVKKEKGSTNSGLYSTPRVDTDLR